MPVQKTITLYTYDELSDKAKERARQWFSAADVHEAPPSIEDAAQAGLKLDYGAFDGVQVHAIGGHFTTSAPQCAEYIVANHGEECDTYKSAKSYLAKLEGLGEASDDAEDEAREAWNEKKEVLDNDFLGALLSNYQEMISEELRHLESDEHAEESILANEYTFRENGEREDI